MEALLPAHPSRKPLSISVRTHLQPSAEVRVVAVPFLSSPTLQDCGDPIQPGSHCLGRVQLAAQSAGQQMKMTEFSRDVSLVFQSPLPSLQTAVKEAKRLKPCSPLSSYHDVLAISSAS